MGDVLSAEEYGKLHETSAPANSDEKSIAKTTRHSLKNSRKKLVLPGTRLTRLISLLETGSTQHIRFTAAQQLADIQKAHPEDLFSLLTKVVPYLRHKTWDTRIAASK